jgi:hypothetical protein
MGSLASVKVKDGYPTLLKTETSTLSSTLQIIEDGIGTNSALLLGTDSIGVSGNQFFTNGLVVDNTELTAVFLDTNNRLVIRELGTDAFSSTGDYFASSPINITSNVINLLSPATLTQLLSADVTVGDSMLMYDQTASAYKGINMLNFADYLAKNPSFTVNSPIGYDSAAKTFFMQAPVAMPDGLITPVSTTQFIAYSPTTLGYGGVTYATLVSQLTSSIVVPASGSNGQIQFNGSGAFAATPSFVISGSAGAETLQFAGLMSENKESSESDAFVFRKSGSPDFLGSASTKTLMFSDDVNTGLGWRTMASVDGLGKYKAVIMDYVMYNDSESKVRVGRLSGCWNTVLSSSATFTDTILTYFGSGIDANPLLRVSISGAGIITIEINNSLGERVHIRAEAKFMYSYF